MFFNFLIHIYFHVSKEGIEAHSSEIQAVLYYIKEHIYNRNYIFSSL